MYLIGLTGGIAAGKSVVSARLVELGAVHVDADLLAREVVEPGTPGLASIAAAFGESMIAADGRLDRAALGAVVFADSHKLKTLNDIVHPAVWRRAIELIDAADPDAVVVYDVPLLLEAAGDRPISFDLVVVVHADPETRMARLIDLRGMTRQEAERRIRSQASDAERLAIADLVIDSGGTLDETFRQVDELWERVRREAARGAPG